MKNKYANFDETPQKDGLEDEQTGGRALLRTKDPVRQHAVRTAAHEAFSKKNSHEREDYASDEFLKAFFKKLYGIEIPSDEAMGTLTAEEKDTLIKLKEHLIKEAKENGIKLGAIKTMEKFSEKEEVTKHLPEGENLEKELATLSEDECGKCIAPQANKLQGEWTQIYGNPTVMKDTYSTILSIMDMGNIDNERETMNVSAKHASCVGMEIGKIHHGEAPLNYFFRDDGERKELHEMNGKLAVLSNKELKLSLEYMDTKLCVVKAGPSDEPQFDYVVFAETSGSNKCSSYFVFARNVENFNLRHYDDISDYMKTQVLNDEALPVAALPKPALCQIS
uniref:Uncharacterized protein n=3 Tax=Panagrolaimus TaxID=55784 RepID=A0A914Y2D5_9BILA